jgi:hypothetical protein
MIVSVDHEHDITFSKKLKTINSKFASLIFFTFIEEMGRLYAFFWAKFHHLETKQKVCD